MARETRLAMSRDELMNFLPTQRVCTVGTLDTAGGCWADLARYVLQVGSIAFAVERESRTLANLEADARVCCAVERNPSYYEIQAVLIHGVARRLGADARLVETFERATGTELVVDHDSHVYF